MAGQQRTLLIIAAVVLVLILFSVFSRGGGGSKGTSDKDRGFLTERAANLIDKGQRTYFARNGGRYTSHLSDLLGTSPSLAKALNEATLIVDLDISTDGKTYLGQVTGSVASFLRARTGAKLVADQCIVLKKKSGFKCPAERAEEEAKKEK